AALGSPFSARSFSVTTLKSRKEGEGPYSPPSRGEQRVHGCGGDAGKGAFPDPVWDLLTAVHEMHLYPRRLRHPQSRIVVKVRLNYASTLDSDLLVQRRRETIDDRALYLCRRSARIHDESAVGGGNDASHAHAAVRQC